MARRKQKNRRLKRQPQLQTQEMEADNPEFLPGHFEAPGNPQRIRRTFYIKESPVMWMLARGYVTKPQAMAATEFRRLYELLGGRGAQAIDLTREFVDGGAWRDSFTDSRLEAAKRLKVVR